MLIKVLSKHLLKIIKTNNIKLIIKQDSKNQLSERIANKIQTLMAQ